MLWKHSPMLWYQISIPVPRADNVLCHVYHFDQVTSGVKSENVKVPLNINYQRHLRPHLPHPQEWTGHMHSSSHIITKIFIQVVHIMDLIDIIIVNFRILHMTVHTLECKYLSVYKDRNVQGLCLNVAYYFSCFYVNI